MNIQNEVFVVVAENNKTITFPSGTETHDDGGPLVFEQYTKSADIAAIEHRAKQLDQNYGPCVIAKLDFDYGDPRKAFEDLRKMCETLPDYNGVQSEALDSITRIEGDNYTFNPAFKCFKQARQPCPECNKLFGCEPSCEYIPF